MIIEAGLFSEAAASRRGIIAWVSEKTRFTFRFMTFSKAESGYDSNDAAHFWI
jgi:hypothetical protein